MQMIVLVLLIVSANTASAGSVSQNEGVHTYPRYIEFPDGDGVMHQVDLEAEPDYELLNEINRNPANNQYHLYTTRNPTSPQTLVINNPDSIRSSNFDRTVPTVLVAHGWLSNHKSNLNHVIRDAFLRKLETNVIIMDWSQLALSDYVTAVMGIPSVGIGLGQFLSYLGAIAGTQISSMHLVGFDLGAHLVGNAGRFLIGRAARITGLDPAGPLWTNNSDCLHRDDGVYVEAIHTDGGYTTGGLGIGIPIGDTDFYPNGGISQPGCLTNTCNHNRAWELFAATVSYNHLFGNECSSTAEITLNMCNGLRFFMGTEHLRKFGTGLFRLDTGKLYPF